MNDTRAYESETVVRCRKIRLGHAYWSARGVADVHDVESVLAAVSGEAQLQPRAACDPVAVSRAEAILEVNGGVVYTFAGCLHPKLGTIGIIITPDCLDGRLQGITRCDSGGLAGRRGAFGVVADDEVEDNLRSLSIDGDGPKWLEAFSDELAQSYPDVRAYVGGIVPDHGSWSDIRARCIASGDHEGQPPDRRLWTWEVRLKEPPAASHFEAIILSHEAFKQLEYLRQRGRDVPSHVKVVHGTVDSQGVHYFAEALVCDLLLG